MLRQKIQKYLREATRQEGDDLVVPQQDWETLTNNLMAAIKGPLCTGCYEKGWHFEDCPQLKETTPTQEGLI